MARKIQICFFFAVGVTATVLQCVAPAGAWAQTGDAIPTLADPRNEARSAVESYMRKNAGPQSTVSFLDWSDFSVSGQTSAITLNYRIERPLSGTVEASVRFTIQAGTVVKAERTQPSLQPTPAPALQPAETPAEAPAPTAQLAQTPAPAGPVIDRFSGPLFAARHGWSMTLQLSNAFSLAQLEQAKEKAQREKKPLGFVMVWGQLFGQESDPRSKGSVSALVHFYEVFHQQLVLVFVRHETELGMVPAAVKKGFAGPDEGGYAPNMAVVDATATEFIVEIPFKGLDGAGRDELFAAGGRKIDEWLAAHPDAMAGGAGGGESR